MSFIKFKLSCMLIAEMTNAGMLALKRGTVAAPLMAPLIITTGLFFIYLQQQHFRVASRLPSRLCMKQDLINSRELDFGFLRNAYLQPEMRHKQSKSTVWIGAYSTKHEEAIPHRLWFSPTSLAGLADRAIGSFGI